MLARRDLRGVVSRDRSTAGELGGTRSADAGAMVVWMGGTGGLKADPPKERRRSSPAARSVLTGAFWAGGRRSLVGQAVLARRACLGEVRSGSESSSKTGFPKPRRNGKVAAVEVLGDWLRK